MRSLLIYFIISFCFLSCKNKKKNIEDNLPSKPNYEKKKDLKISKISKRIIEKIPDSLQSIVGSCGTECAIVYNAQKIEILSPNKIAVHFDTEQIVQENVENHSKDLLLFTYDATRTLISVSDDTSDEDILSQLHFSLAESIRDFGKRMSLEVLPKEKSLKTFKIK